VTVEEKRVEPTTVAPVAPTMPVVPATMPMEEVVAEIKRTEVEQETPNSASFIKAQKAIASSASLEALELIENQVHKSEKLTADEKPVLLTLVLKKRKEL